MCCVPLMHPFSITIQQVNANGRIRTLHQIRRYPAPYISKAGQKATPLNILQPFIPHCFPLQSPYINSRPFNSSPHYFDSSPIRFRICPTPAQPTSILTRIVFPADQQSILNDQFYVSYYTVTVPTPLRVSL